MSLLDIDQAFDQQSAILLEKINKSNQSPFKSRNNNTEINILDLLNERISKIEEKINSSDSIYRLAVQSNAVREKERRNHINKVIETATNIENRVNKLENLYLNIPKIINDTIIDEIEKKDQSEKFHFLIDQLNYKFEEKISKIEEKYIENNKKTQNSIKKLRLDLQLISSTPKEDSKAEEIALQIEEMKRRQNLMLELLNTMKSHNDKDFDLVNSQISGLWSQLTQKRE